MYWLEKTYHEREAWLEYLKVDPWFDSLRSDKRFQDMLFVDEFIMEIKFPLCFGC